MVFGAGDPNTRSEDIQSGLRGDWGILSNVGDRDAIGVTLFASLDGIGGDNNFAIGPAARYRRWLKEPGSVDAGLGVAVAGDGIASGSLFAMVKVSPNPWVGIALRPEVVRLRDYAGGPTSDPHFRAALGIELGDVAGLVATPVAVGIAVLATLAAQSN
ncbi:MAG TPA: hypothetical protein VLV16_09530 [Gemmatimonadales bacterium]|nr:hypothetical protein [Gemmatimonadales bacterium]